MAGARRDTGDGRVRDRTGSELKAEEQQDTVMVYAVCPICNRSPVIPACYITTPIIAGVMHTIYYCQDCFNAHIRPWARSFAGMDKVFNRIG